MFTQQICVNTDSERERVKWRFNWNWGLFNQLIWLKLKCDWLSFILSNLGNLYLANFSHLIVNFFFCLWFVLWILIANYCGKKFRREDKKNVPGWTRTFSPQLNRALFRFVSKIHQFQVNGYAISDFYLVVFRVILLDLPRADWKRGTFF